MAILEFLEDPPFPDQIAAVGTGGGPTTKVEIVESDSGYEFRNLVWSQPRRTYDVAGGIMDQEEYNLLMHFFLACNGPATAFRFQDPNDYTSTKIGIDPDNFPVSATDQIIAVGDMSRTKFQLVKNYSASSDSAFSHVRVIKKPRFGTVRIAVQGAELTSGWSVDYTTGIITFQNPPAFEQITAGFLFDTPVRFVDESIRYTFTDFNLGDAQVPLIEVRL